jgi:hypothetical protein
MTTALDAGIVTAAFVLPRSDGSFEPEQSAFLKTLGQRRRSVLLAFAPKAAGTFLRTALIYAVEGQLTRVIHAQGGRDGTPYLPCYLLYLGGGFPASTLITHVHMQALPANRHLVEALDLKPVIMLRSVPDMLVSYLDMIDAELASPDHWLNLAIPPSFAGWDAGRRADFLIDTLMPWYASYFATWRDFLRAAPGRVKVLRFADVRARPAEAVQAILDHSGLSCSEEMCELAVEMVWRERFESRFNRGEDGRGRNRFTADQLARIERMLFAHYGLEDWRAELMP